MIALDTNILVDLMVSSSNNFLQTTTFVKEQSDSFCTTPTNIGECLRLMTHKKVFSKPLKTKGACHLMMDLIDYYRIVLLDENVEWWKELEVLCENQPDLSGNEIFDARIARCLKSHKIRTIMTRDSDFKKYNFLKTIYPA